jgi:DNA polymerase (family 10)
MDNPYCSVIGHPTGRLLGERPGYELDIPRLVEAAAKGNVFFEVNAQPERLDLSDTLVREAVEGGAKIAISTDAHSPAHLGFMRYGIGQARRGWLRGYEDLLELLKR